MKKQTLHTQNALPLPPDGLMVRFSLSGADGPLYWSQRPCRGFTGFPGLPEPTVPGEGHLIVTPKPGYLQHVLDLPLQGFAPNRV